MVNTILLFLLLFPLQGQNSLTENLLKRINDSGKLHMVPANLNGKYVIRFAVVYQHAVEDDIKYSWDVICKYTDKVLRRSPSKNTVMFGFFMDNKYSAMHSTSAPLMQSVLGRLTEERESGESTDEEKDDGPVGRLPRLFSFGDEKKCFKLKNPPMRRRRTSVSHQSEGLKNLQEEYRKLKMNNNDNNNVFYDNDIPDRPPTLQRRMTII